VADVLGGVLAEQCSATYLYKTLFYPLAESVLIYRKIDIIRIQPVICEFWHEQFKYLSIHTFCKHYSFNVLRGFCVFEKSSVKDQYTIQRFCHSCNFVEFSESPLVNIGKFRLSAFMVSPDALLRAIRFRVISALYRFFSEDQKQEFTAICLFFRNCGDGFKLHPLFS